MTKPALPLSSSQPDAQVLSVLAVLQPIALGVATLIGSVTLLTWLLPSLGTLLPSAWMQMKAMTAVCVLLSALSLALSVPLRSANAVRLSRIAAATVLAIAIATLIEIRTGIRLGVDLMSGFDLHSPHPGRMSVQTSSSFVLLSFVLLFLRARKGWLSRVTDVVTMGAAMLMLTLSSAYLFGAERLVGTYGHRISHQTLAALICLTIATFNRRAEYGSFSILLGIGIGSATARLAAPVAIGLPFLLAGVRACVIAAGMPLPYGTAIATSVVSLAAFGLVLLLARRVAQLESEIRELSLRDGLTGLYNRRGFYLLAEQALRLSRRSGEPFSILFIDLDNLKQINDTLGHEVGSELLQKMSSMLEQNFRETDVAARLGGDEFVVAGKATAAEIAVATYRLQQMTNLTNERADGRFTLSFSYGHITSDHRNPQTLEAMIEKADKIMYESKRSKHAGLPRQGVPSLVRSGERVTR